MIAPKPLNPRWEPTAEKRGGSAANRWADVTGLVAFKIVAGTNISMSVSLRIWVLPVSFR
jgi:hypothetical protein